MAAQVYLTISTKFQRKQSGGLFLFLRNVHANISSLEGSVFNSIRRHRGSTGWRSNIWSPGEMFQEGISILGADNRTSNIFLICANLRYLWWIPKLVGNWRGISHFTALRTRARKLLCCSLPEFLGSISHLFSIPLPVLRAPFSEIEMERKRERERERETLLFSSFYNWCFLSRIVSICLMFTAKNITATMTMKNDH